MKHETTAFDLAAGLMEKLQFTVIHEERSRPWGGFLVIDEKQAAAFAGQFFPGEHLEKLKLTEKLSPKILIVAPHKRLSWQYHHRRAEIWCCIHGSVAVAISHNNEEGNQQVLQPGDTITLYQGQRHRLIGLNDWAIVAEIWQHTDSANPSDEDDIVRLQDDFGRD